eukprot:351301-Chlamydomonas_euryale.AAC.1
MPSRTHAPTIHTCAHPPCARLKARAAVGSVDQHQQPNPTQPNQPAHSRPPCRSLARPAPPRLP